MPVETNVIVVGGGIAGASVAATLAARTDIVLLEREPQPGYHATGRSAAYFAPAYGNAVVRGVTALSAEFYRAPPSGFSEVPLLRRRSALFIGRADQSASVDALAGAVPNLERLGPEALRTCVPILAENYAASGLRDDSGGDLDVDAILQGYLRSIRRDGGQVIADHAVTALDRTGGRWRLEAGGEVFTATTVVNAAGAWADGLAALAGLAPLGLEPMRRTALLVPAPGGTDIRDWPMVVDVDEDFYFKPEAGTLLVSPADETPSPPCDAQPEEYDVALAVDRFERATSLRVDRVTHRWAGLRTFAPDKTFVCGFDPRAEGFFWLAGQGGYGVQAAPGLADMAAALIDGTGHDEEAAQLAAAMQPSRLLGG